MTHVRLISSIAPLLAMLAACASTRAPRMSSTAARPKAVRRAAAPEVQQHPTPLRAYLAQVHEKLAGPWDRGVRQRASEWLAPDHPANSPRLVATVALHLDANGQLERARLEGSSGYGPFDNSALKAAWKVGELPPLPPSLAESHVTLSWALFRNQRGCSPKYARVHALPMQPREALALTLRRQQFARAQQILEQAGPQPALLQLVAAEGLRPAASASQRQLAARIAEPARLIALLADPAAALPLWRGVLESARDRRETAALIGAANALARHPGLQSNTASAQVTAARLMQVLKALAAIGEQAPAEAITGALASGVPRLLLTAVVLAPQPKTLADALAQQTKHGAVALVRSGVLRALPTKPDAVTLLRVALQGPQRVVALEVLQQRPLPALAPDLVALTADRSQRDAPRAAAIQALAKLGHGVAALYALLREGRPALQVAAAQALVNYPNSRLPSCYRLALAAYKAQKGPTAMAAIKALATLAHPRLKNDIHVLVRRLSPADQADVAPHLAARIGANAVPTLRLMLASSDARTKRAAYRALGTLRDRQAKRLVKDTKPPPQPASAAQPQDAVAKSSGGLDALLRAAVKLSSTRDEKQTPLARSSGSAE